MAFIELAQKYDYLEFEKRLKAVPGVLRVEHSKQKPSGKHYVQTYLHVFTEANPKRFIQMELTTHGHRENTDTCSALYTTPPNGLQEEADRILRTAVAGWELNPLIPKAARKCPTSADHEVVAADSVCRRFRDCQS